MNSRLRAALDVFGPRWWVTALLVATMWVWQRYTVVLAGHRIEQLQTHIAELERVRVALLAEDSRLSSRGRIEEIAIDHLGMIPTPVSQRVRFTCATRPGDDGHGPEGLPLWRGRQAGSLRLSQAGADRITDLKDF